MTRFIEELREALEASLEPVLVEKVFIDEARLKPGYLYNEVLASAICRSLCMVVVYSPIYERHPYCLREYRAMEILQEQRMEMLQSSLGRRAGLIVPILLRGKVADLPQKIKEHIHFCDFSKFTTASPKIRRNRAYVEKIELIAEYIYELYQDFEKVNCDPCRDCGIFSLPAESEVAPWRIPVQVSEARLPLT